MYLGGVTAWGAWLGRGARGGEEYFLGRRDLPWLVVLLSVVATETSTLTFLSIPGIAYGGSLAFLQIAAGYVLGRIAVAAWLLPAYHEGRLRTAYELLEARFGPETRRFTSALFMITRLLADSVRLFATAIPLTLVTGWPLITSVLVIGALTFIYTFIGGIRAVVWVDASQMVLYLAGGLIALVVLGQAVPGGWPDILARAAEAGKLTVIDPALDFGRPYTLWAGLLGGAFLSMGSTAWTNSSSSASSPAAISPRAAAPSSAAASPSSSSSRSSSSSASGCGRGTTGPRSRAPTRSSPASSSRRSRPASAASSSRACSRPPCPRSPVRSTRCHRPPPTTSGRGPGPGRAPSATTSGASFAWGRSRRRCGPSSSWRRRSGSSR